jgi:hypothetical protein
MNRKAPTALIAGALLGCTLPCAADSTRARCDIYPEGSDKMQTTGPCTFSQRQGYITITRDDGLTHELSPVGDRPGNFRDQDGNPVYRQSGLAETGLIFRFPSERVFVYWDVAATVPAEVLGEPVADTDPTVVQETIITRLLEQYADEKGIRAEPAETDAYREFLRQREADGAFAIRDQALEASFWRYFTDDSMHDFMTPGGADEARAFTVAPWEPQP